MLTLTLADAQLTSTLGPVAAICVACGMLAGLTLLPALLTIFGRKGFWPRHGHGRLRPRHGDRHAARASGAGWATGCSQRPGLALAVTSLIFIVGALGILSYKRRLLDHELLQEGSVESVEGFELMEEAFPAGTLARPRSSSQRDDGQSAQADLEAASSRGRGGRQGRVRNPPTRQISTDGTIDDGRCDPRGDPFTQEAFNACRPCGSAVEDLGPASLFSSAAARRSSTTSTRPSSPT